MRLARVGDTWLASRDGRHAAEVTDLVDPFWRHPSAQFPATWASVQEALATALFERPTLEVETDRLDVPFPTPPKIVGLLGNDVGRYTDHGKNAAAAELDYFLKARSSLVGPSGSVRLPNTDASRATTEGARVVPECELAVVIGRGGNNLAIDEIVDQIVGYTIGLDLTMRGQGERSARKSYDTFCPVGPWLVTPDEVGHADNLGVRLWVGDVMCQDWCTSNMISPVAETIAFVSRSIELEPGDLILTGAPRMTHVLAPNDKIRAEIERVGTLEIAVSA